MPENKLARFLAIVRLADRLLRDAGIREPPVTTDLIHRVHPELSVRPAALGSVGSSLKIEGGPDGRSIPAIYVNERHSIPRQRFGIAHEYGHYLLHHRRVLEGEPPAGRAAEQEADLFAGSLLAPAWMLDLLAPAIDYRPDAKTELDRLTLKLASKFNVSRTCMARALFQLHHLRKALVQAP